MISQASVADQQFRRDFEAGRVRPEVFNHRGHLRLAYTYWCEGDDAYGTMKRAILSFLDRNGVNTVKYHETITCAWLQAVRHFMEMAGHTDSFEEFINKDVRLLDKRIMSSHYSSDLLDSQHARTCFVAPDLEAIPLY